VTFSLIALAVAVLASVAVGRSVGAVAQRLRPAQAVVLLAVASLVVSLATGIALTAIAVAEVAGLTAVAADGHWSATAFRAEVPVPEWLGALAAGVVTVLLLRAAVRTTGILVALVRAERLCRSIRTGGGPVVVVDDGSADAYTVAGIRGCVVISQRLLTVLDADERRVLTAHELSHLNRRHHLYVHLADLAAAANPLVKPVCQAVRLGVERWADEDAAAGIGNRRITGRALARVALLRSALTTGTSPGQSQLYPGHRLPVLAVGTLQVASRVEALFQPARNRHTGRVTTVLTVSLLVLVLGVASLAHIREAIEGAAGYLGKGR